MKRPSHCLMGVCPQTTVVKAGHQGHVTVLGMAAVILIGLLTQDCKET